MTATQVKRRRGTEAQCEAMTPVEGEVIVDTTNDRLRLGDGTTAGGIIIPNAADIQQGAFNTVASSGTNTITATLDPVPAGYTTNMTVIFKAANTNSGAATMNVNSLGAKNIYKVSGGALGALSSGDIVAGAYYTIRYDGTQFVLEGSTGGVSSVTAADTSLTISPTAGAVVAGINTNNYHGVGSYSLFSYTSASLLAAGSTTAGTNLVTINISATGAMTSAGGNPGGTWRNISGVDLQNTGASVIGLFIRTA